MIIRRSTMTKTSIQKEIRKIARSNGMPPAELAKKALTLFSKTKEPRTTLKHRGKPL